MKIAEFICNIYYHNFLYSIFRVYAVRNIYVATLIYTNTTCVCYITQLGQMFVFM